MDQGYIPNTRIQTIRKPITLPSNYLSKLKDLEPIRLRILNEDKELDWMDSQIGPRLDLKFAIQRDMITKDGISHFDRISCEPQLIRGLSAKKSKEGEGRHSKRDSYSIPEMDPKLVAPSQQLGANAISRRLSIISHPEHHQGSPSITESKETDDFFGDPWESKSISYMLDIWQQAEGINVEPILSVIREKGLPSITINKALEAENSGIKQKISVNDKDLLNSNQSYPIHQGANTLFRKIAVKAIVINGFKTLPHIKDEFVTSPDQYAGDFSEHDSDNSDLTHSHSRSQMSKDKVLGSISKSKQNEKILRNSKKIDENHRNARNEIAQRALQSASDSENEIVDLLEITKHRLSLKPISEFVKVPSVINPNVLIEQMTKDVLSEDTYNLLQRFSREDKFDSKEEDSNDRSVREILLGQENFNEPVLELFRAETSTEIQFKRGTILKPDIFKHINRPGAIDQIVNSLLVQDGKPIDFKQFETRSCHDFKLNLPKDNSDEVHKEIPDLSEDIPEIRTNTAVSGNTQNSEVIGDGFGMMRPIREASTFILETLKQVFGKDLIVPVSLKTPPSDFLLFCPVKLDRSVTKPPSLVPTEVLDSFSLRKLATLIKSNLKDLPQNEKVGGNSNESPSNWSKFLESNTARLSKCPENGDSERDRVFDILCKALHQETSDELRYESCKLLIETRTYMMLGRWDTLSFKKTLTEIIEKGSDDQIDAVCHYFAKLDQIDARVVDHVKLGLGNLQQAKRNRAINFYSHLGKKYSDIVIPSLIELGSNMNWKVRYDVVIVLGCWIPKLIGAPLQPPAVRDPDALDTDSDELVKALFHTLGTLSNENAQDDDESRQTPTIIAPAKKIKPLDSQPDPPNKKKYFDACINGTFKLILVLLKMMWNDHNQLVRSKATNVLGEQKQGKPVYDWIIQHMSSVEPLKRIEALRCISALAVIASPDIPKFIKCFSDHYASVRIEACKAACVLKSGDRDVVNCLLDRMDDSDFKVRAYAIKGK